jgi:GGDEF domain-containing protein
LDIDKHERDEMLARWQMRHRALDRDTSLELTVAQLIDEACKGVASGRIATEPCAQAGASLGRTWRERNLDAASLVEEIATIRRSVWDTVVARYRAGSAGSEALVEARTLIDLAFDTALRRAVGVLVRETQRAADSVAESSVARTDVSEPQLADFHAALAASLRTAVEQKTNLALVVLHFDTRAEGAFGRESGGDLVDLSDIIGLQIRREDRSFSLSDSDFALLLPSTSGAAARQLLERIAYSIRLYTRRGGIAAEITGGYSVAPDDGTTPIDLIRIALADREFSLVELFESEF